MGVVGLVMVSVLYAGSAGDEVTPSSRSPSQTASPAVIGQFGLVPGTTCWAAASPATAVIKRLRTDIAPHCISRVFRPAFSTLFIFCVPVIKGPGMRPLDQKGGTRQETGSKNF